MTINLGEIRHRKHGFRVGRHFWLYEFACPCEKKGLRVHDGYCGGAVIIDPNFVREILDPIRDEFGQTRIVSGFRCWNYHAHIYALRKKPPTRNSSHLDGVGADLWTQRKILVEKDLPWLEKLGITGIGSKDGRVTHIDVAHSKLTRWAY